MIREKQIKKQADIYTDDASNYTEWSDDGGWSDTNDIELVEKAFIEGAKWADTHPKSPWINYKEEKPPFGVEVIAYHHKWIDEDFNPNGTRIGFLSDEGFTSAFWWDYQDCYETISKQHCESNKDFYANHIDNIEPEFWCPFPKLPKE